MKKITKKFLAIGLILSLLVGFSASMAAFAVENPYNETIDANNMVFTDADNIATIVNDTIDDGMAKIEVYNNHSRLLVENYVAYFCFDEENRTPTLASVIRQSRFRDFILYVPDMVTVRDNVSVTYVDSFPHLRQN